MICDFFNVCRRCGRTQSMLRFLRIFNLLQYYLFFFTASEAQPSTFFVSWRLQCVRMLEAVLRSYIVFELKGRTHSGDLVTFLTNAFTQIQKHAEDLYFISIHIFFVISNRNCWINVSISIKVFLHLFLHKGYSYAKVCIVENRV